MSKYGKQWEDIRLIREEIKRLVPTANTNSLNSFKMVLDILIDRWKDLESEMEDE